MRTESVRDEAGFTLLEVLVAFVIAALAIGALFQGAITGLRSARTAGHYEEAISRARSRLASIGVGGHLVAGEQSGDDGGGFSWRSRVAPISSSPIATTSEPVTTQSPRAVLYAVSVSIGWSLDGGKRQVTLQTERLGASAAAPP